jgi:hypothetical protein
MPVNPPVTVNYPDFSSRLANAIIFPDTTAYPPISTVQVETRFDSDNLTVVPSVSTTYIYRKTALLVSNVDSTETNGSPFGDNASTDAFGRLRVGIPQTLFDSKLLYDKAPFVFDEVISSGSSTFVPGDSLVVMSTSAASGYVIRQSSSRFNYQPGKSMFTNITFVAAPEANIIKRMGLFQGLSAAPYTPSDGFYLEIGPDGPSFNIVKTEGTVNTITVPQSSWNVDRLDGTGSSGLALDFTKGQIFAADYEWLGLGRIRFGFYLKGKLYYAHYVTNFNALTTPYMTSPNQPIRYEIRQTGAGTGTMKQICSTVVEEGAPEEIGYAVTAATSGTITVQNGVDTPVLAVRLAPGAQNLSLFLKEFSLYNTDNTNNARYTLYRDPTITGGSLTWNKPADSYFEFAYGSSALTVSAGYTMFTGFIPKSQGTSSNIGSQDIQGLIGRFGTKINGTPDILVIAARGLGSTLALYAAANAFIKS